MNLPIYLRNVPPPLETFNHPEFLQFLISWIKPVVYLELGVSTGITFSLCAKYSTKAICVDVNPCSFNMDDNMEYYQGTTDDFFSSLNQDVIFDAVFIDADHSHEQSLKDFLNVKDRVIEDGFIFLHDTYPYDEMMMNPNYCHDAYKTAHYIKNNLIDDFEILTLPFNPGLTIIKKMKREKQLIYQQ